MEWLAMSNESLQQETVNLAAPFEIDEIFFSRTDRRGVISSGNSVFQRTAGYDWERLLGAPHRLIRHPDMPKAVFWLLWQALGRGEPLGAYVKNRSECGRYYWVYAVVTPIREGFLSVRIKPTSDMLETIEKVYADIRQQEKEDGLSPEASAAKLLERLADLGFADYDAFSAKALATEFCHRAKAVDGTCPKWADVYLEAISQARDIHTQTSQMRRDFELVQLTPINMHIQSSRLGEDAAAIKTISENYRTLAMTVEKNLADVTRTTAKVVSSLQSGLFDRCVASIQREVREAFAGDDALPRTISRDAEAGILSAQEAAYDARVRDGMTGIRGDARHMVHACSEMRVVLLGLGMTGSMCRLESARLKQGEGKLNDIVTELERFQERVGSGLEHMEATAGRILAAVRPERLVA